MTLPEVIHEKRSEILRVAALHGAGNVRVFGSVVRGEDTDHSDLDLLVTPMANASAWFPVGLITDLEALLGRKVDVVTEGSLHRLLRRRILEEARPL